MKILVVNKDSKILFIDNIKLCKIQLSLGKNYLNSEILLKLI